MAKKRSTDDSRKKWHKDWSVKVRVSVERHGKTVLEESTADLLAALERTHSITAAARSLGISYRHAWLRIQTANAQAGQPLVETAVGGERGGGTQLTEYGRAALHVYRKVQENLRGAAAKSLPQVLGKISVPERNVIHLAAAISLQEVIAQILGEFALVRPTVSVRTLYGASNELAEQIEQGGTVDVFIAASREQVNQLAKSGLVRRGSRRVLASNGLAIVSTHDLKQKVSKPSDLKKLKDCQIVVADPACPLGSCTERYLEREKPFDKWQPHSITVDNSRAVIGALRAGGSRVGIIFSSDLKIATGLRLLLELPAKDVSTDYEAVGIATSSVKQPADDLLEFLQSATAATCFQRCGFMVAKT